MTFPYRCAARRFCWIALILIPVTPAQTLLAPQVHAIVTFAQTLTAFALVVVALRLGREPARVGKMLRH